MQSKTRTLALAGLLTVATVASAEKEPIRVAHVNGMTGAMEAYTLQLRRGMQLGFDYATDGTFEVEGRKIEIIEKDTQLKPERGRSLVAEAMGDDDAHFVVGPVSSGVALSVLPLAQEYEKIIIPQAVSDAITGESWNRYVFRVTRNSSQDAIANAAAVAGPGVCLATVAQDYAFGRDGVAAFKKASERRGAKVVHTEFVPFGTTDFTAAATRIINSLKDASDCTERYIWPYWAGAGNPLGKIAELEPERYGIEFALGGNILPVMALLKPYAGSEGAAYYYYELPDNEVNDWLVKEHFKRFNEPPDFFTAQGMAEAMAIVTAVRKTGGSTDTEDLIEAMEGMRFMTPRGELHFRAEDHQAMQHMYHTRLVNKPNVDWAIPEMVRVIPAEEMDVPINNHR